MRVLPERTTDAWTSWYLLRRFPLANLWAPTQNDVLKWDFGFQAGPGKGFVLETKGVLSNPRRIRLQLKQLAWYAEEVVRRRYTAVYYVLPHFPWPRPASGAQLAVAPPIGQMRRLMPFERWTFVIDLEDLIRYVLLNASIKHAQLLAKALLVAGGWKQVSPHHRYDMSEPDLLAFRPRMTLQSFCHRIRRCDASVAFHYFSRSPTGEPPRHAGLLTGAHIEMLTELRWSSIVVTALGARGLEIGALDRVASTGVDIRPANVAPSSMLAMFIPGAPYESWRTELRG